MANTLLRSDVITYAGITDLNNELSFTATADKRWEPIFEEGIYKKGDTINVRQPVQFKTSEGQTAAVENIEENTIPLTIEKQFNWRVGITGKEDSLTIDDFNNRYVAPAMSNLANKADSYIASKTGQFPYFIGTPGVPLSTAALVNQARARMTQLGIPSDKRFLNLDFSSSVPLSNDYKNNFNPILNKESNFRGVLGNLHGFDIYEGQHLLKHTSGAGIAGGTPPSGFKDGGTTTAIVASGNTITLTGFPGSTSGLFLKDDAIYIDPSHQVYIVNKKDGLDIRVPAQFSVAEDAPDSTAGGEVTITVNPSIISDSTDPQQNISQQIPAGAQFWLANDHVINLAYHQQAIAVASPALRVPRDKTREGFHKYDDEAGIDMRTTFEYSQEPDVESIRMDFLMGATIFWFLGLKILG